ncbi:hypothetical protein B9P82_13245 [Citrobacter sp. L55]|uniref:hypothetical protein n=1 Tax=Citrobacter sp. L55 TaxID=1981983 RepID=UPI000C772DCF|nr:hypothetical protein [Citrobacter sp. L55]PLC63462.1 hypothetical protein B9P82_13245 [Citrobacter sp. L55]
MKKNVYYYLPVYSHDWTRRIGLESIAGGYDNLSLSLSSKTDMCDGTVSFVDSICKSGMTPEMVIIDLPARSNVGLIVTLRKNFPETVMMFVQKGFLYSDRMVAEYMGGILLKEYDVIFACYPHFSITEFISSGDLNFPQPPVRVLGKEITIKQVLNALDCWIGQRLPNMISSARGREILWAGC